MFCYQDNQFFSPALPCSGEKFREIIDSPDVKWKIEAIRSLRQPDAIKKWGNNSDYQKYCIHEGAKKKSGKAFKALPEEDKLAKYANSLKESLPPFIFGAREFDELPTVKDPQKKMRRRALKGIHLSGLFMFDVDHVDNPKEIYEKTKVDGFPWEVVFAHATSSDKGLRLVCKARLEVGNIADNQIELAKALNVKADASCIDACRISYAPMREDVFFVNEEELLNYYNEEFDKKYCDGYRQGHTEPTKNNHSFDDCDGNNGHIRTKTSAVANKAVKQGSGEERTVDAAGSEKLIVNSEKFIWRGYDVQGIIDQRYADKLPCKDDSNRHTESLKLATDLMLMLDGDKALVQRVVEAQPWVQEIIEERDENVEQTVESAASCIKEKEKKYASSLPSKAMQEAIKAFCGKSYLEIVKSNDLAEASEREVRENSMMQQLDEWGMEIEKLSEFFPLIKEACKGKPRTAYPATLFVSSALLGTLMTRTWYHFYFDPTEERRLNYCIYIIGDPSVGKSMAGRLYKILASPIIESDRVGNDAINQYKKEVKARNTSDKEKKKEALKEPDPIIRCFGSRTANGVFIESMVRALEMVGQKPVHLHLLTFDSELDNQTNLTKGGSWIDKSVFELKCFHNEEDSQSYKNMDSVNGPFDVFWNFVYTGTPVSLRRKVTERNFGSGLATRLACIPLPPSNFKMVELNPSLTKDTSAEDIMREWAYKLDKVSGELPIWPLVEHTWHWCNEHMQLAELGNDRADEMLIKRVPYYGIASAIPFIMMRHWDEWEEHRTLTLDEYDFELSTLVMNIQYRCQHYFFGEYARNYFEDKDRDEPAHNRTTRYMDCYRQLPELFTREELAKVFDVKEDYSYTIISRFVKDRAIEKDGKKTYRKLKKEL